MIVFVFSSTFETRSENILDIASEVIGGKCKNCQSYNNVSTPINTPTMDFFFRNTDFKIKKIFFFDQRTKKRSSFYLVEYHRKETKKNQQKILCVLSFCFN